MVLPIFLGVEKSPVSSRKRAPYLRTKEPYISAYKGPTSTDKSVLYIHTHTHTARFYAFVKEPYISAQ